MGIDAHLNAPNGPTRGYPEELLPETYRDHRVSGFLEHESSRELS